MASRYWSCSCGERWPRTKQKCTCGKRRPKRRVPRHARTLRDDSYTTYVQAAEQIHGVTDESCCVCGRPRHDTTRHHRDHDHVTGLPRGLACYQCNALMPRLLTLERARAVVGYLERVDTFYAALAALSASHDEATVDS